MREKTCLTLNKRNHNQGHPIPSDSGNLYKILMGQEDDCETKVKEKHTLDKAHGRAKRLHLWKKLRVKLERSGFLVFIWGLWACMTSEPIHGIPCYTFKKAI
ncbi:hypothetical protein U1Q18_052542 [Sarracenia purpurea var. burkii]